MLFRSTVPLAFVPEVSASTRNATDNWGLSFGLLLLNLALGLSLYRGIYYDWGLSFGLLLLSLALGLSLYQGRGAIQPPVPATFPARAPSDSGG